LRCSTRSYRATTLHSTGAMRAIAATAYGDDVLGETPPAIETRNGKS
jgi:hypothetical protein